MPTVSLTIDQAAARIASEGWYKSVTLTYGFRATGSAPGFQKFTPAQISAAEDALELWSDVAKIKLAKAADGYTNNATILFSATTSAPDYAWAYFPGSTASSSIDGDVFLNTSGGAFSAMKAGTYEYMALMHEIGHALGLEHPGAYNGGQPSYSTSAEYVQDSRQYTIMSYFDAGETGARHHGLYAVTPMLHDIAAAQTLYGANMATRAGNTVYGFHSNANRDAFHINSASQKAVFAIWDGGGTDTLDFSGYSKNATIDLGQGAFSSVGGLVKNVAIAKGCVIENAFGGAGSDTITGNAAANILKGNAGADKLEGREGRDVLTGGAGADKFIFNTKAISGQADVITDFTHNVDKIAIENAKFAGIGLSGILSAKAFYNGTAAHDASDRIIYDQHTGALLFDQDGSGAGAPIRFAVLSSEPVLTATDFLII